MPYRRGGILCEVGVGFALNSTPVWLAPRPGLNPKQESLLGYALDGFPIYAPLGAPPPPSTQEPCRGLPKVNSSARQ